MPPLPSMPAVHLNMVCMAGFLIIPILTFRLRALVSISISVGGIILQIMLALGIPAGLFQFRLELSGGVFTTTPNSFVYSAEDYAFFTPSIHYAPYNTISLDLGVDIRISPEDRQRTSGVPDFSTHLDLPKNYPPWKAQMGLTFSILPAGMREQYGGAADNVEIRRRLNFYEKVMEEKEKAAQIEKEIENIRKIREAADVEIEKLREELE